MSEYLPYGRVDHNSIDSLYGAASSDVALEYALKALENDTTPDGIAARKMLKAILEQQGCEHLGENETSLTTNIDIWVFG